MRAEEKITKAQKRKICKFFPETPSELLSEEQWLGVWSLVEPQIKANERDWYGRNIAYRNRTSEHIKSIYRANYLTVAQEVEYCRAQNVKRRELSDKLGIELPAEFPNPVTAGYNRAQSRLHEELIEEWASRRRLWKHVAEGRLKNGPNDEDKSSYHEVLCD